MDCTGFNTFSIGFVSLHRYVTHLADSSSHPRTSLQSKLPISPLPSLCNTIRYRTAFVHGTSTCVLITRCMCAAVADLFVNHPSPPRNPSRSQLSVAFSFFFSLNLVLFIKPASYRIALIPSTCIRCTRQEPNNFTQHHHHVHDASSCTWCTKSHNVDTHDVRHATQ